MPLGYEDPVFLIGLKQKNLTILMDFPNDSERSWIVGHHFDSTVWFMDIYCAIGASRPWPDAVESCLREIHLALAIIDYQAVSSRIRSR